tara:strand:+ start:34 stop:534 length:501 start_codon:yes stop_codon:yes gene_type:complete
MKDMAEAREQQRRLMEAQLGKAMPGVLDKATKSQQRNLNQTFGRLLPAVIFVCGLWIAALAMLNTRDRRQEIGVLRALGQGGGRIALLFIGKAVVIGLLGALIGYAIGVGLALQFGRLQFTQDQLGWNLSLLGGALLLAPAFAAVSSFIPAMLAVTQDPADTLRHD